MFIRLPQHWVLFTGRTDMLKNTSDMSKAASTYDKLKAKHKDLQGQVLRYLKVIQDQLDTKNQLGRDLDRYRAIHDAALHGCVDLIGRYRHRRGAECFHKGDVERHDPDLHALKIIDFFDFLVAKDLEGKQAVKPPEVFRVHPLLKNFAPKLKGP